MAAISAIHRVVPGAGSCSAWSMVSNLMARCLRTRPSVTGTWLTHVKKNAINHPFGNGLTTLLCWSASGIDEISEKV